MIINISLMTLNQLIALTSDIYNTPTTIDFAKILFAKYEEYDIIIELIKLYDLESLTGKYIWVSPTLNMLCGGDSTKYADIRSFLTRDCLKSLALTDSAELIGIDAALAFDPMNGYYLFIKYESIIHKGLIAAIRKIENFSIIYDKYKIHIMEQKLNDIVQKLQLNLPLPNPSKIIEQ